MSRQLFTCFSSFWCQVPGAVTRKFLGFCASACMGWGDHHLVEATSANRLEIHSHSRYLPTRQNFLNPWNEGKKKCFTRYFWPKVSRKRRNNKIHWIWQECLFQWSEPSWVPNAWSEAKGHWPSRYKTLHVPDYVPGDMMFPFVITSAWPFLGAGM